VFRLKQVAEILGCSLSNVYALGESGKLPIIAIGAGGKGYRVSEADLKGFLDSQKKGRKPEPSSPQCRPSVKRVDWKKLREGWKR
jgi:excisionase family DNA binding protein